MTQRVKDGNGWYEVRRNPISRVGVFDYMGSQLGLTGADATRVYKVLRPAEELSDPAAMDSFRLLPLLDGHTMIGDKGIPAESKGVHGYTGDLVEFDTVDGTLYSNVKVVSKSIADAIDAAKRGEAHGKRELSCGYACRYDFTPGVWRGQAYDAVQRGLRGNHVALVKHGRMGSQVAVLDQMTFTVDAKDLEPMRKTLFSTAARAALAAATAAGAGDAVINACDAAVKAAETDEAASDEDDMSEDAKLKLKAAEDAKAAAEKVAADAKTALDTALAEIVTLKAGKTPPAADAATTALDEANTKIATLQAEVTKLTDAAKAAPPALDEATIFKAVSDRNILADRLKPHVGVFAFDAMTLADVAKYGIEKLGLKNVVAGHELSALDAYLQAKPAPMPVTMAADGAAPVAGGKVAEFIAGPAKK